ncbi:hypothetical protein KKH82_05470 [Patescibacteria group bacterium]|nr:hypothetical protein [Patescibacteria group bacterium]
MTTSGKAKIKANKAKKKVEAELGLKKEIQPSYTEITVVDAEIVEFEDPAIMKARVEGLAWQHIEKRLRKGFKDANSLAKMVIEPNFPKTKISLTGNINRMKRPELIGHMKKLVNGK